MSISFGLSGSSVPFSGRQLILDIGPRHRSRCFTRIVYRVFSFFSFFFNHSKIATEHRWHRFLPSGTIWLRKILLIFILVLPAHLLLISSTALWEPAPWSFLWLHKQSQTALTVWFCVHLSLSPTFFLILWLPASPSVFLPLPRFSLRLFFTPSLCSSLTAPLLGSTEGSRENKDLVQWFWSWFSADWMED